MPCYTGEWTRILVIRNRISRQIPNSGTFTEPTVRKSRDCFKNDLLSWVGRARQGGSSPHGLHFLLTAWVTLLRWRCSASRRSGGERSEPERSREAEHAEITFGAFADTKPPGCQASRRGPRVHRCAKVQNTPPIHQFDFSSTRHALLQKLHQQIDSDH